MISLIRKLDALQAEGYRLKALRRKKADINPRYPSTPSDKSLESQISTIGEAIVAVHEAMRRGVPV